MHQRHDGNFVQFIEFILATGIWAYMLARGSQAIDTHFTAHKKWYIAFYVGFMFNIMVATTATILNSAGLVFWGLSFLVAFPIMLIITLIIGFTYKNK